MVNGLLGKETSDYALTSRVAMGLPEEVPWADMLGKVAKLLLLRGRWFAKKIETVEEI